MGAGAKGRFQDGSAGSLNSDPVQIGASKSLLKILIQEEIINRLQYPMCLNVLRGELQNWWRVVGLSLCKVGCTEN